VDPSVFERPVGQAFRKEERSVLNEPVATETPVISAGIRIRVESNTRDAMNTRILEQMPFTAARNITPNDILKANKPLVQEMNPDWNSAKNEGPVWFHAESIFTAYGCAE
jgi:shikimate kinase